MTNGKILKNASNNNSSSKILYDQYLGLDWAEKTMAIARLTNSMSHPKVFESRTSLYELKEYLKTLKGTSILVIEETTTSHWLYVELKDFVTKIFICDPYRNHLLSEGAKTDKIDARKLVVLLRAGLLKEVFHNDDESFRIRKLVSGYNDLVNAGVRALNQKSALYRAEGLKYKKDKLTVNDKVLNFVDNHYNKEINLYKEQKKEYEKIFNEISRSIPAIKRLEDIGGIGTINAVKIFSTVIDARRFENKYKYWSYCGLVYNQKESGGRNYGRKKPRYSRQLKAVYRNATLAAIGGNNDIRHYYEYLLSEGLSDSKAKNAVARYIAKVSYAMMKHNTRYRAFQWRESKDTIKEVKEII